MIKFTMGTAETFVGRDVPLISIDTTDEDGTSGDRHLLFVFVA